MCTSVLVVDTLFVDVDIEEKQIMSYLILQGRWVEVIELK